MLQFFQAKKQKLEEDEKELRKELKYHKKNLSDIEEKLGNPKSNPVEIRTLMIPRKKLVETIDLAQRELDKICDQKYKLVKLHATRVESRAKAK